jgi:hypothetical protein
MLSIAQSQQVGGLQGFQFPVAATTNNTTVIATQSSVGK